MKTCEYAGAPFEDARSHPWYDTPGPNGSRYYDLLESPAHIRSSMEDFKPWAHYPAIETFYALLERLNHKNSALESNDCAFDGPHANESAASDASLECSGRVMVLFRVLTRNTDGTGVLWLKQELHHALGALDPDFVSGVVGTTLIPVRYLCLPEANDQQLGRELMISFWAWGDTEADTMRNLGRLLKNLTHALRKVMSAAHARG